MTLLDLPALSLLRSCRQIYHETANLPYILIKFRFSDSTSISKFVDQRTPAQLQAIRHLVLDTYQTTSFVLDYNPRIRAELHGILPRLPGLRDITVHVFGCVGVEEVLWAQHSRDGGLGGMLRSLGPGVEIVTKWQRWLTDHDLGRGEVYSFYVREGL
jgi:hypothetical protein